MSWERPRSRWAEGAWLRSSLYVVVVLLASFLPPLQGPAWQQVLVALLAFAACASVLVRHTSPYAFPGVALAMAVVHSQALVIPALFSLGLRRRNRHTVGIAILALVVLALLASTEQRFIAINGGEAEAIAGPVNWALNAAFVVVVPMLLGQALGVRRELVAAYRDRAERAEAERDLRDREAVLLERARIAGESHDVLGHKLSLLTLQAGGLEVNARSGAAVTERQARLIGKSAREALRDLRHIIGALDGTDPSGEDGTLGAPPHGIIGIDGLVAASRASGAAVKLDIAKTAVWATVPAATERAVYRIVQESLTNAHRHAPKAQVEITIRGAAGRGLDVVVLNRVADTPVAGSGGLTHLPTGGRGLTGLLGLPGLVGGTIEVESSSTSFVVRAHLPWPSHGQDPTDGVGGTLDATSAAQRSEEGTA